MRNTVRYTAGLMVAAGAVLAFSTPAMAADNGRERNRGGGDRFSLSSIDADYYQSNRASNSNWNNQTVLNNIGNTQYGKNNYNGGGTAFAINSTDQYNDVRGGDFEQYLGR
ncbi:hypothetical protein [Actinoplanes couchii]|uniref:Uncharacterized protein n=1 Tax=Actinoplanes couchii TaxID=403638 RepID=A0ABQ3WZM5_9ACTN|nr:hypothetical protein [Actinoplanes couchii]MDR6316109.1 hypothetical protein [Actinoplanes couchii]GID51724.1 hypothetical protein Aco03nite_001280 [Actinoplanes couchii]